VSNRQSATMLHFEFKHIGVVVPSIERAAASYRDIFGYRILSGPVEDPIQKVSVCFLATEQGDDAALELVSPLGEDSPVGKFLANGAGAYHMCYEVLHMENAIAHVRSKGCLVISNPVPATAFGGRRIVWFYTPTRQLIELVER
jgi:methylmalonyl-CoA/ethylmalonyl-CoA epimerase